MSSGSSRTPRAGGGNVPAPDWLMQTGGLPRDPSQIDSTAQAGLSLPQIASRQDGYNPNLSGKSGPSSAEMQRMIDEMRQQQQQPEPEPMDPMEMIRQRSRGGWLPAGMTEDDPLASLYRSGSAYQK